MSSTNRVKCSPYSSADICAIIRASRESHISEVEVPGLLKIKLIPDSERAPALSPQALEVPEVSADLLAERERVLKQDQIDMLRLQDPQMFEELLSQGELIPPKDDDDAGTLA